MSPVFSLASALGLIVLRAGTALAQDYPTCRSYGMDFQNGGFYFQNSLSTEYFTFVSQFSKCENDVAYNLLVDPTGEQTLCSDTALQPDDTNQLSTCPIQKNQLYSGNWSVVIFTNNGAAGQVAYERDFALSVGPQSTVTYTPTVTVTSVSTPIATTTITTVTTITSVADPSTVTSPSITVTPTQTVTPLPVLTTTTMALLTIRPTSYIASINQAIRIKTASCRRPRRQSRADPTAKIRPTVGPAATGLSQKFRREYEDEKRAFVAARAARLAERAPDPQPLTITDMNTSDYPTSTTTSFAPTITATITFTAMTTTTTTPPPITVFSGNVTVDVVTTTLPPETITLTKWTVATSVMTRTFDYYITVTSTTTPAASATACRRAGGIIG